MKLSIIIPAYNEEKTIREIIEKVKNVALPAGVEKEIIVVNDGSQDRTAEILKEIPDIIVLHHTKNQGKGMGIRTGLAVATGDIIVIQDADLEYDPNFFPILIQPILQGQAKVVYGSRFLSGEQKRRNIQFLVNKHHKAYITYYLGGRFLSLLANWLYGARLTDEATCYKVFRADIIKNLPLKCKRFEFCPEVTAKVLKRGYKILEIPIGYEARTKEEGKKIKPRDGLEAIWTLLKYRFID